MRRARLADRLVDDLAAEILGGALPPGTLLPPEPLLCARFAVSRTVVREAVARLARSGLLDVRQGAGTVVRPRADWHDLDPELLRVRSRLGLIDDLAEDLHGIRRMVEVEVAGRVAAQRTAAQLAELEGLLRRLEETAGDPGVYNEVDIAFHEALIAAAGNDLLRKLMRPLNDVRRIGYSLTSRWPDSVAVSMDDHRAILAAVRAGDPEAARAAMASHVSHFERLLERELDEHRPLAAGGGRQGGRA